MELIIFWIYISIKNKRDSILEKKFWRSIFDTRISPIKNTKNQKFWVINFEITLDRISFFYDALDKLSFAIFRHPSDLKTQDYFYSTIIFMRKSDGNILPLV